MQDRTSRRRLRLGLRLIALLGVATTLSGCIVVPTYAPYPYGRPHRGYYYYPY